MLERIHHKVTLLCTQPSDNPGLPADGEDPDGGPGQTFDRVTVDEHASGAGDYVSQYLRPRDVGHLSHYHHNPLRVPRSGRMRPGRRGLDEGVLKSRDSAVDGDDLRHPSL